LLHVEVGHIFATGEIWQDFPVYPFLQSQRRVFVGSVRLIKHVDPNWHILAKTEGQSAILGSAMLPDIGFWFSHKAPSKLKLNDYKINEY
jgi:hypothetical protein